MDVAPWTMAWCYKWTGLNGSPGGVRHPAPYYANEFAIIERFNSYAINVTLGYDKRKLVI